MGFFFRRSIGLGPFRINLSKSGVGWSIGGKGFRTGRSATGKPYSSVGVPGTGMGYRTSRGCFSVLALTATGVTVGGYVLIKALMSA